MIPDDSTNLFKPTGLEQFYIISLFDIDSTPFIADPNQMSVQAKLRGGLLDHYTWDVKTLSEYYSGKIKIDNYDFLSSEDSNWLPIIVNDFLQEQGSNYIKPVLTFNPVTSFAHLISSELQTKINFSLNPFIRSFKEEVKETVQQSSENEEPVTTIETIPDTEDVFLNAKNVLYDAFILPGYPILITSTLRNTDLFGPLFINKISISVTANQAVQIDVNTVGGRCLKSSAKNVTKMEKTYRTFKNYDCNFVFKKVQNYAEFEKEISSRNQTNLIKILSMRLEVTQTYDIKATAVHSTEKIEQGPRFFTLAERSVKGTLTFYAQSSAFIDFTSKFQDGLSLYFGEPFLFVMQNILWQKPRIKLSSTNDQYLHEYDFIAFAADGAFANAYKAFVDPAKFEISEFIIPDFEEKSEENVDEETSE